MSRNKEKILIIAGLSLMLAILFAIPVSAIGSEDDGGNYIGPDGCKFCHLVNYDEWMMTNHSRAFQVLVDNRQDKNESCIPCHVTGYNNKTKTYKYKDITCEACHGSGDISANIAEQVIGIVYSDSNKSQEEIQRLLTKLNLTKKSMVINLTAEMCGRCHQGDHHPTYEEWNKSLHAQSMVTVKSQKTASDSCLKCQSVEWITAGEHSKPTLKEVTLGLTCEACHNVHNHTNAYLLRKPKNVLCESCHTMSGAKPPAAVHHASSEMRRSIGGIDTDTYIYQPNAACADCHRYTQEYNASLNQTGITGHEFKLNFNVCMKCHEGFPNADEAEKFVRNQQQKVMDHYNETMIKVNDAANYTKTINGPERATYDRVLNESIFNMQFIPGDYSKGEHNPKYAEELIHKAEIKADNILRGKPEAPADIPGFDFMAGLMTLLLAVLAVALKNRK
ncbi:Cytochrome c554 and c-prime [uncultured archaeon]|nr:Cytochrome c554 and c-prime [uncultured archaeon]